MKTFIKLIHICLIPLLLSCSNDDDRNNNLPEPNTQPELNSLTLSEPIQGEKTLSVQPALRWEEYISDEEVVYEILLGTSENNLQTITDTWDSINYIYGIDNDIILDTGTTYYWRVIASENGIAVAQSGIQSFITETILPELISENAGYGARKATGVAVFNTKIWVIGGRDDADNALNDIWSSVDGENWVNEGVFSFGGIYGHKLIAFNNKLWIYGGIFDSTQSTKIFSSQNGIDWIEETQTTPFVQYQSSRFSVLGDKIYRIAGYSAEVDELSTERYVYSSSDGLNWNLETENHGFDTKYQFQIESLDGTLYSLEPNSDSDIDEIKIRNSQNGADWSDPIIFNVQERGINSIGSIVLNNKIILMTTAEDGSSNSSTFYESVNGTEWTLATSLSSVAIRAIYFDLVNLNGQVFAIGGTQRSNFGAVNNTVWKLN